eukprot:TRINITY_DN18613_c0_g1_i1.p1 TRINITY_DN18613_c0_g1~~TRINITY_DN18613_c0_g1_i1.p1  ORF type:complete len:1502 (-),score=274.76 TRINITY_DN18613_c0_g1_i1:192-4274(-)
MEGAADVLAVIMGPWGTCCSDAPAGIITSALQDIADIIRLSADHRRRCSGKAMRGNHVSQISQKDISERLYASILGRSIGRSFHNLLLMTKVLLAFREMARSGIIRQKLTLRQDRQRAQALVPDLAALPGPFRAWVWASELGRLRKSFEQEVAKSRHALVDVWARGRNDLVKAVQVLHARILVALICRCLLAWWDLLRINTIQRYSQHLLVIRRRNPPVISRFLSPVEQSLLLTCLVCWASSSAVLRQNRLLEDTEQSYAGAVGVASDRQTQLLRARDNVARLSLAGRASVCRAGRCWEQWLLQTVALVWKSIADLAKQNRATLEVDIRRKLTERDANQRHHKGTAALQIMMEGRVLTITAFQRWHDETHRAQRKQRALSRGQCAVVKVNMWERLAVWEAWQSLVAESKALERKRHEAARRMDFAESASKRFRQRLCQHVFEAWLESRVFEQAQRMQKNKAMALAAKDILAGDDFLLTRIIEAWSSAATADRVERERAEAKDKALQATIGQVNAALSLSAHAQRFLECHGDGSNRQYRIILMAKWQAYAAANAHVRANRKRIYQSTLRKIRNNDIDLAFNAFLAWSSFANLERQEREGMQAVQAARMQVHQKTLVALSRSEAEAAETLVAVHFSAWRRQWMEERLASAKKKGSHAQAAGKMLLEGNLLLAQCLALWARQASQGRQESRVAEELARREAEAVERLAQMEQQRREDRRHLVARSLRFSGDAVTWASWRAWVDFTKAEKAARQHGKEKHDRSNIAQAICSRKAAELNHSEYFRCFAAWYAAAAILRGERRVRDMREEAKERAEELRQRAGIFRGSDCRSFLILIFAFWQNTWRVNGEERERLKKKREHENKRKERCMMFVLRSASEADKALTFVAMDAWMSALQDAREMRARSAKMKQQTMSQAQHLISSFDSSLLLQLFCGWHAHWAEMNRERTVASAHKQARNFKLRAKQQKLEALDLAQCELERTFLLGYLLRWAREAKCLRLVNTKKTQSMDKGLRAIASSEGMILEFCFTTWLKEAHSDRQRKDRRDQSMARCLHTIAKSESSLVTFCFSILVGEVQSAKREHLDGRLNRAAASRQKALLALERTQSSCHEQLRSSVTRAWHQVVHGSRRQKKAAQDSTMRNYGAAQSLLLSVTLVCWAMLARDRKAITTVIARETETLAKLSRCMTLGRNMSVKLRRKLLLIQVLRAWQHAFCYEELLRILGHTQVDLAKVAEAAALAETAATLAAKKSEVTVRLLPSGNSETQRWPISHVPSTTSLSLPTEFPQFTAEVSPAEHYFQAPVISLQKDIQRHYNSYQRPCDRFRARPRPQSAGARRIHQDVQNAIEVASEVSEDSYRELIHQSRRAWG